jgi:hypothetical protein
MLACRVDLQGCGSRLLWQYRVGDSAADVIKRLLSSCTSSSAASSASSFSVSPNPLYSRAHQLVMQALGESFVRNSGSISRHLMPFHNAEQVLDSEEDAALTASLADLPESEIDGLRHVAGAVPLAENKVLDDDAVAAQRLLFNHQHPRECKGRRFVVFTFDRAYWGFAANMNFLTVIFNYAIKTNRIVITANPDRWNYAGLDCRQTAACHATPALHPPHKLLQIWLAVLLPPAFQLHDAGCLGALDHGLTRRLPQGLDGLHVQTQLQHQQSAVLRKHRWTVAKLHP